jgi:hypothetical protein
VISEAANQRQPDGSRIDSLQHVHDGRNALNDSVHVWGWESGRKGADLLKIEETSERMLYLGDGSAEYLGTYGANLVGDEGRKSPASQ